MRLILFSMLILPLMAISCIDKDFEKELKFVQSIINQPDSIQSIIKNSEFYDSTLIDLEKSYFFTLIKYFDRTDNNYSFKSYVGPLNHKGIIYDNIKSIRVYDKESEYAIIFSFKEVDKKWKLLEIAFIKML